MERLSGGELNDRSGYSEVSDDELSIDHLAEKLVHLCVAFLTQRFQQDDGPRSPP